MISLRVVLTRHDPLHRKSLFEMYFLSVCVLFLVSLCIVEAAEKKYDPDAPIHLAQPLDPFAVSVHGARLLSTPHTNNWAVLVCTSRFWFNYRHMANALSFYRTVKRLGVPDSQIILMLADDVACNARNACPGTVFNNANRRLNLYAGDNDNVEVDYRGYEVTVENFIRVLTDRLPPETPRSKRLATDDKSNILVYMTGHGGDGFLKFQDSHEISSHDLADAFQQMWEQKRYRSLLFMIDTCQANTMYEQIYSPNIIAMGSSWRGENSYSHHMDMGLGVAVIDRFTFYCLEYLERLNFDSQATLEDMIATWNPDWMSSHPGVRRDLYPRPLNQVRIMEYFGNVLQVYVTPSVPLLEEGNTEQVQSIPLKNKVKIAVPKPTSFHISQEPDSLSWLKLFMQWTAQDTPYLVGVLLCVFGLRIVSQLAPL